MKKSWLYLIFSMILIVCMLLFSESVAVGISAGISYCLSVLIPSLFPFMVAGSFFTIFLNSVWKGRFQIFSTFLISAVGGYPVGAVSALSGWRSGVISKKRAENLICTCVNPSPSFLLSVLGANLLGNYKLGIILGFSVYISSVLLCLFVHCMDREKIKQIAPGKTLYPGFVPVVAESGRSILLMSLLVILFCGFQNLVFTLGVPDLIAVCLSHLEIPEWFSLSLLPGMLEIMSGANTAVNQGAGIGFLSFITAFGGICVHFQIFSLLRGFKLPKVKFYAFRFLHGGLSLIITKLLMKWIPVSCVVFSTEKINPVISLSSTIPGTIALIFLIVFLLISLKNGVEIVE